LRGHGPLHGARPPGRKGRRQGLVRLLRRWSGESGGRVGAGGGGRHWQQSVLLL